NERLSILAMRQKGRKRTKQGKENRKGKSKAKRNKKEVVTAIESSVSGIGSRQSPIRCDDSPEFQGFDSSSQVFYSCGEDDKVYSQDENDCLFRYLEDNEFLENVKLYNGSKEESLIRS